jgi:4-alpha-glucanotransferase
MLAEMPEFKPETVDFGALIPWKVSVLEEIYKRFKAGRFPEIEDGLGKFKDDENEWLDDFALFMALKDRQAGAPWWEWDAPIRSRQPEEIARARQILSDEIAKHEFLQFLFFDQWKKIRDYARSGGIKLVGDIPIFVALDSADVWSNPNLFHVDKAGAPTVVAGVPPDYFSETGQLWGNPLYRWEAHAEDGYRWWVARLKSVFSLVDFIRLDHFRGFAAAWHVPAGEETAVKGSWVKGPGGGFFQKIKDEFGSLPLIAEDLGVITPDVTAIREKYGLPGMQVMVFAFDSGPVNQFLPHNHRPDHVVYTGTHDNDTAIGWYRRIGVKERSFFHHYLNYSGDEPNWELIRAAWASVGVFALAPAQDILGLGNEARMNYPSRPSGNWQWRMLPQAFDDGIAARIAELNQTYARDSRDSGRTTPTSEVDREEPAES